MRIYDGSLDRSVPETKHTVFVVSCGVCAGSDVLTLRRQGRKDWTLLYCERGEIQFKETLLKPGQILVYPPQVPQWYLVRGAETAYRYLHFTGSDLAALMQELSIPLKQAVSFSLCGGILEEIRKELSRMDRSGVLRAEGLVLQLLAALSERSGFSDRSSVMFRVTDAMEHSLSEEYDGEKYARMLGVSLSRFNHLFSEYVGMPPKRYFLKLRIRSSCRMLEYTDLSVGEISALTGYGDPLCFGQIFKKYQGCSPTEYRRRFLLQKDR